MLLLKLLQKIQQLGNKMDKWLVIVIILFCLNILLFMTIAIYEIKRVKKIGQDYDNEGFKR